MEFGVFNYNIDKHPEDKALVDGNVKFAQNFVDFQARRIKTFDVWDRVDREAIVSIFEKMAAVRRTYSVEDKGGLQSFFDSLSRNGIVMEGNGDEIRVLRAWLEMFYARYKLERKIPVFFKNRF